MHSPCFGTEELHVGADLFAEVKCKLEDGHELGEDFGGVGAIHALEDCSKQVFNLVVVDASEVEPLVFLRTVSVTSEPTFMMMASVVPTFVPMMA